MRVVKSLLIILTYTLVSTTQTNLLDNGSNGSNTVDRLNSALQSDYTLNTITSSHSINRRNLFNKISNSTIQNAIVTSYTALKFELVADYHRYTTALSIIARAISELSADAPPLGSVLGAAFEFYYGLIKVQIRSATKLTREILQSVAAFLHSFFMDGVLGFFHMALETASGVWIWCVYGLPLEDWYRRGGLDNP
ncbi:MAG: hypothetical protein Q9222_003363 [Ikaeria aurantiellina]